MDIWAVSTYLLMKIILLWTLASKYLFESYFQFFESIYLDYTFLKHTDYNTVIAKTKSLTYTVE